MKTILRVCSEVIFKLFHISTFQMGWGSNPPTNNCHLVVQVSHLGLNHWEYLLIFRVTPVLSTDTTTTKTRIFNLSMASSTKRSHL